MQHNDGFDGQHIGEEQHKLESQHEARGFDGQLVNDVTEGGQDGRQQSFMALMKSF